MLCLFGFLVDPSLLESSTAWVALLVSGIALAALVGILVLAAHPQMAGRFREHENWMRFIGAAHIGVARLRADPQAALAVLGTAMIYQVSVVLTVGFVILTIGAPVPVGAVIAFVPVVAMAQVIPISLSGLGVREGMFVLLLHPLGIPNGQAIGIGLLWYLTMLLVSLLGAPAFAVGNRPPADERWEPDQSRERDAPRPRAPRVHRRLWAAKMLRDGHVIYWWVEMLAIGLFYIVYSAVRNADKVRTDRGVRRTPRQLMDWQQTLGINHELTINEWALHFKPLVIAANYFYGSLHFVVTIGVGDLPVPQVAERLPALAQHARHRHRDRAHRLPVLAAHAAAPAGHHADRRLRLRRHARQVPDALDVQLRRDEEDLEPVRGHAERALLLGAVVRVRARAAAEAHLGEVARRRSTRCMTVAVIVITANHYFLDAVGGFAIFGIGYVGGPACVDPGRTTGPATIEPTATRAAGRARARDRPRSRRDRDGRHRGRRSARSSASSAARSSPAATATASAGCRCASARTATG